MKKKENGRLDRFTFALGSVTLATPFSAIPIIPDDRINRMIDQELRGAPGSQRDTVRAVEDFLARYFAPGCRQAV
jgi:hypothetical protein